MYHFYSFPQLPTELSIYIYKLVQHNAVNHIISVWYKHIAKKTFATQLMLKITNNNIYISNVYLVDCFSRNVEYIMKYCSKVLTGIEDREWWNRRLVLISHSISLSYNNFNYASLEKQKIYLNICLFYKKIYEKFNFTDYFLEINYTYNDIPNNTNINNNLDYFLENNQEIIFNNDQVVD